MTRLTRPFYTNDVLEVAPELLGKTLIHQEQDVRHQYLITEIEIYRGEEDTACHAAKGRTARTEIMYHEGGFVYVYLIYGMYWMLNIVAGPKDKPQAILIRGTNKVSGPGRVGRRLKLDKTFYGEDLTSSNRIWLENSDPIKDFLKLPRVGIDYANEPWKSKNWRYIVNNDCI